MRSLPKHVNYTTEDSRQSKARQRNSGDNGRQRVTKGDKGRRGALQPGKATHMKGDKRRQRETRSPGTRQQSSECRQSLNEFRTPTVDCLGNKRTYTPGMGHSSFPFNFQGHASAFQLSLQGMIHNQDSKFYTGTQKLGNPKPQAPSPTYTVQSLNTTADTRILRAHLWKEPSLHRLCASPSSVVCLTKYLNKVWAIWQLTKTPNDSLR